MKLTPFISRLRTVEILDPPQKIISVDTELTPWFGCIVWPNMSKAVQKPHLLHFSIFLLLYVFPLFLYVLSNAPELIKRYDTV